MHENVKKQGIKNNKNIQEYKDKKKTTVFKNLCIN